jgi:acetylornithine aminotransferase/acetylornithine/N-succinyldiaminopimelate aminotransferase
VNSVVESEDKFQLATYKKMPIVAERGEGVWIYTSDDDKYLDLYGGHAVAATGHCHPHVVRAIREQADKLLFYSNLVYSGVRARAAEKLARCAPAPLRKVFFCNSGTEANENAMRMARMKTGRERVVTFTGGFHGRTADSISATFLGRYREIGKPNVPGHLCAEFGSVESVAALADETVAAVMLEPVQSMAGVTTAPPEFFRELRRLCDERGMLLIFDEVQTGIGRTGSWFFAGSEAAGGVVPDIVTLGKPMGNGHPVAAVITRAEIVDRFGARTTFFSTFGGNPVACAAALAVLDVLEDEDLVVSAATVGDRLRSELRGLAERHPAIGDVRGRGLMTGVELVRDRATREPFGELAGRVKDKMAERGLLIGLTGRHGNVLKIRPPLCITRDEAGLIVATLDVVLSAG